jgi:hypothetical protein
MKQPIIADLAERWVRKTNDAEWAKLVGGKTMADHVTEKLNEEVVVPLVEANWDKELPAAEGRGEPMAHDPAAAEAAWPVRYVPGKGYVSVPPDNPMKKDRAYQNRLGRRRKKNRAAKASRRQQRSKK